MSTDSNKNNQFLGCAMIKKSECSLLITENWIQSQHNSCVICDGQKHGMTSLALSTSVFLVIITPPMLHIYLCIITAHTNRTNSGRSINGLSLHSTNKNILVSHILEMFSNLLRTLLFSDKKLVNIK